MTRIMVGSTLFDLGGVAPDFPALPNHRPVPVSADLLRGVTRQKKAAAPNADTDNSAHNLRCNF
jgi:hypothetical protein